MKIIKEGLAQSIIPSLKVVHANMTDKGLQWLLTLNLLYRKNSEQGVHTPNGVVEVGLNIFGDSNLKFQREE